MSNQSAVIAAAHSQLGKPFSQKFYQLHHQSLEAYCAAFVRWAFEEAYGHKNGGFPVVERPEYYRRHGINYVGALYTADGLAGDQVGQLVKGAPLPGDILLFRDTYEGWVRGTITHVGIAASATEMYDAGGGSIVHRRSFEATFPGKLVEVRRPNLLAAEAEPADYTRIHFAGSQVSAKLKGKPVRDMEIQLNRMGTGSLNGRALVPSSIKLEAITGDGRRYKLFKHDGKARAIGMEYIWIDLHNGMLEVSVIGCDKLMMFDPHAINAASHDYRERKRLMAESWLKKSDEPQMAMKPISFDLTIHH